MVDRVEDGLDRDDDLNPDGDGAAVETPEAPPEESGDDDRRESGLEVARRKEYEARRRAERERDEERARREALEQQLSQNRTSPAGNVAGEMTEAQIVAAYERGDMDALTAEERIREARKREEEQREERLISKVEQRRLAAEERTNAKNELDEYIRAFPDLKDESSDLFGEVRNEYQRLRRLGGPDGVLTEHLAVRTVIGSLSRAKRANSRNVDNYDRENRATHRETGSADRPDDRGRVQDADLRRVPREQRDYWTSQGRTIEEQRELAKAYHATH